MTYFGTAICPSNSGPVCRLRADRCRHVRDDRLSRFVAFLQVAIFTTVDRVSFTDPQRQSSALTEAAHRLTGLGHPAGSGGLMAQEPGSDRPSWPLVNLFQHDYHAGMVEALGFVMPLIVMTLCTRQRRCGPGVPRRRHPPLPEIFWSAVAPAYRPVRRAAFASPSIPDSERRTEEGSRCCRQAKADQGRCARA